MVHVVLLSAAFSAVAGQAPRIPRDASEWASFTDAEKRAAVDYQWQLLQGSLANGTAVIHTETAAALPVDADDDKWAFESVNYTVKGWHGAQLTSGGTWLLGPDAYCTLTVHH